jgi:hypothetical protein
MRRRLIFVLVAAAALLPAASCDVDAPCDSTTTYVNGSCKPIPRAAPGSFGAVCKSSADCVAPSDTCFQQGTAAGFCSAVACNVNTTVCPQGWTCLDLSQFQADAPWGCMPGGS